MFLSLGHANSFKGSVLTSSLTKYDNMELEPSPIVVVCVGRSVGTRTRELGAVLGCSCSTCNFLVVGCVANRDSRTQVSEIERPRGSVAWVYTGLRVPLQGYVLLRTYRRTGQATRKTSRSITQ